MRRETAEGTLLILAVVVVLAAICGYIWGG